MHGPIRENPISLKPVKYKGEFKRKYNVNCISYLKAWIDYTYWPQIIQQYSINESYLYQSNSSRSWKLSGTKLKLENNGCVFSSWIVKETLDCNGTGVCSGWGSSWTHVANTDELLQSKSSLWATEFLRFLFFCCCVSSPHADWALNSSRFHPMWKCCWRHLW